MIMSIVSIVLGYLMGCFQSSYFLGKWFRGIDIREHGNSNAGASNTTVVLGWKFGITVGVLDILKAVVSILVMSLIVNKSGIHVEHKDFILFLNGAFVMLGHNFPFFLKFKGGKGTASFVGLLLTIDWKIGLIAALIIVVTTIVTNYIALGTILMMIGSTVLVFAYHSLGAALVMLGLALMSIYLHIPNCKRMLRGEEKGLRSTIKKKNE